MNMGPEVDQDLMSTGFQIQELVEVVSSGRLNKENGEDKTQDQRAEMKIQLRTRRYLASSYSTLISYVTQMAYVGKAICHSVTLAMLAFYEVKVQCHR